jgi:hypothetical protein
MQEIFKKQDTLMCLRGQTKNGSMNLFFDYFITLTGTQFSVLPYKSGKESDVLKTVKIRV